MKAFHEKGSTITPALLGYKEEFQYIQRIVQVGMSSNLCSNASLEFLSPKIGSCLDLGHRFIPNGGIRADRYPEAL